MKNKLGYLIAILFIYSLLATVIQITCFDRNFYKEEYQKIQVANDIGISEIELLQATDVLLDYTSGKRADLVVKATIWNEEREVFNQREKDHMVDVRNLYLSVIQLRNIAVIFMIGLMILAFIFNKKDWWLNMIQQYNQVSVAFIFVLLFLLGMALIDFTSFWTNFHHIFFAGNDLWMLDPNTDILIMMVPEQFFYDLVMRIVIWFSVVFFSTNGIGYFMKRKTIQKYQQEIGG